MAGASTAALAATVSNAGALGGFGGTDSSPDELREVIRAIRRLTDKPFIVNLYLDRVEPYVLGASGVQVGTAFVACPETEVNPAYVQRLLTASREARCSPMP